MFPHRIEKEFDNAIGDSYQIKAVCVFRPHQLFVLSKTLVDLQSIWNILDVSNNIAACSAL